MRRDRDNAISFGASMRRVLIAVLMSLGLLAGCEGEPVYRGVSFIAYNYTQYDIDWVRLSDSDGGRAATSQVSVGAGGGSVSCCYTLRGTDLKAEWRAVDSEVLRNHLYDKDVDKHFFVRKRDVSFPATVPPEGDGPLYLEMHVYPDEHVEIALSRKLMNGRLPIVDTARWLWREHRPALQDFRDGVELTRVIARVTKTSWGKYRIEDGEDMRQYMKMYFTVASDFDKDPAIAAVLNKKDRQPGEFASAMETLSAERLTELKRTGLPPGEKNG